MNIVKDKVAVITGSGRGIGREIALLMIKEGAKVVINDVGTDLSGKGLDPGVADAVVKEIKEAGGEAVANYDSVATYEGGKNMIQTALKTFGKLDIVVHVAGILRDRMVFNMSEEEWDDVIRVHLKGTFNVCQPATALFRQQKSGRIICFSSVSAAGNTGQANYAAAKAGILGFVRTVAKEMAKYNVTVNAIWPGADTRMTASVPERARELRTQAGVTVQPRRADRHPRHVAPVVVYLASDDASDITGQCVAVTGDRMQIISHPEPVRTAFSPGGWTVEKLQELFKPMFGENWNLYRI
ncbi:MAG: SDR family oxidoreductase [Nitrospinae bacterium]|nr:SDR family oxidoreductase [Nitrospinota bacterium]